MPKINTYPVKNIKLREFLSKLWQNHKIKNVGNCCYVNFKFIPVLETYFKIFTILTLRLQIAETGGQIESTNFKMGNVQKENLHYLG